ncbi:MAG: (2Fe-2S)-binding protein, partial [Hyphomicrobiales bacterium]
LKSAGLVPDEPMVLVGNGPLLYLLLAQYRAVGAAPAAVLLTGGSGDMVRAAPHLPGFVASGAMGDAIRLLGAMRQSGARIVRAVRDVCISGESAVEAVSFLANGRRRSIPARLVCLHEGVVPNIQATSLTGCEHHWDRHQRAFLPVLDKWGNTTVDAVQVAGDGGGIAGARAGELTGRLAVLEAARGLGRISKDDRDRRAAPHRRMLARLLRARPLIDTLYAPRLANLPPADETIVCRCEEVTAGQVRRAVREGCLGPNQVKASLRCGMGACQGRYCGLTVSRIIAATRGVAMDEVGYFRIRPPLKPIDLGALADAGED